jgi:HEAT repeat protein
MDDWPGYITQAFEAVCLNGTEVDLEKAIESFASRWGGLDLDIFKQVLEEGEGQDRLIALFALGSSQEPEARLLLLPFLASPHQRERWASAMCLGQLRNERAIPVLKAILLEEGVENLAGDDSSLDEADFWYETQRECAASLLAAWHDPQIVPFLRQALQATWQRGQERAAQTGERSFPPYPEDAIAFALGELGAFGALLPLEQPSPRLRIALIHMALGYLYTKGHRYQNIMMELDEGTPLGNEVIRVLEEHVGVSTAQAKAIIEQFLDDYAWQKRY